MGEEIPPIHGKHYFTMIVKQSFTSLEYPSFLKFREIR